MRGDVCLKHGCSHCCTGTEMELAPSDIERLGSYGHEDFYIIDEAGPRLVNVDGRCFFLDDDGRCTVYGIRPKGCRLYPLAMRLPSGTPVFDEECPFANEFTVDPDEVLELRDLVRELTEGAP